MDALHEIGLYTRALFALGELSTEEATAALRQFFALCDQERARAAAIAQCTALLARLDDPIEALAGIALALTHEPQ